MHENTERVHALEKAGSRVRADVGPEVRPRDVVVPVVAAESVAAEEEEEEGATAEVRVMASWVTNFMPISPMLTA